MISSYSRIVLLFWYIFYTFNLINDDDYITFIFVYKPFDYNRKNRPKCKYLKDTSAMLCTINTISMPAEKCAMYSIDILIN